MADWLADWLLGLGLLVACLARSTRRAFDPCFEVLDTVVDSQKSAYPTSIRMETSSPNSLPPSSPLSFHSIKDFHSSSQRPNTADASLRQYRGVQRLPYELREHCMIYFEEGLCMLSFQSSVLALSNVVQTSPPSICWSRF